MTLLHGVPDSVLWSLAPNEILQQNLLNEAKARGIGPERLVLRIGCRCRIMWRGCPMRICFRTP